METAQYYSSRSDDRHPFNVPWLDSCFNSTLLPGSPWQKVSHKIGETLADKVKSELEDAKKRQMIFKLTGQDFVQTHFNDYPNFPSLLFPPNMSDVEHKKLENQTKNWLLEQCTKAAEQIGCHISGGEFSDLSLEMTSFVNHTYSLVEKEMELALTKHEFKEQQSNLSADRTVPRSFSKLRPKSIESKDVKFTLESPSTLQYNYSKVVIGVGGAVGLCLSPAEIYTCPCMLQATTCGLGCAGSVVSYLVLTVIKDSESLVGLARVSSGPELGVPALNYSGSEVLGDAICSMILQDSGIMTTVCERLSGRLLPKTLRQLIWMDKLLKSDKNDKSEKLIIIEKEARGRYGKILELKLAELNRRSATRSAISGLIENAVVEKYRNTPCMQHFAADEDMILESSKTLNILYVYNGTYEPYIIHWLFPIQMAFMQTPTTAEHPYELFMYLHLLIKTIFPSWLDMFAMAERVMSTLKTEDIELFTHLHRSFRVNVTFDPKDFLVELIAREREEALKLCAVNSSVDHLPTRMHEELLTSPVIFLRKWMGEGFVNSLDLPAVLLIWDQLFMQDWNLKVMESFCLAILMLLKDSIMSAEDYPAIRQIFLYEGCHLFTCDIQRAWIHLQQGGLPADIPGMNQLRERSVERDFGSFRKICPLGIKDVLLKLVLPLEMDVSSSSQTWWTAFDPAAVKLTVSVLYGDVMLSSKTSSVKPILKENLKKNQGNKNETISYTVQFNDVFEFDLMDPSDCVSATKSGAEPFILLRAVYSDGKKDIIPLGWTKVELFEKETTSSHEVWKPRDSSVLLSLHHGMDPGSINTPGSHMSNIQLTVYNPGKESETKIKSLGKADRNNKEEILPMPLWIKHSESTVLPSPTSFSQAFDLYIDALHYIPDNATITKVSGEILNSGKKLSSIVAFPNINSSARNPEFNFCQTLNIEEEGINVATSILFQVSTVDSDSGSTAIIGNAILRVFNDNGKLNVGGFQLKLTTGLPHKRLESIVPSDLHQDPVFPCCSLLIRLLPHSKHPEPLPRYSLGYYFTNEAKPTRFEQEIMSTFQKDVNFPKLVKDMAGHLMEKEQSQVPENQWIDWIEKRIGADSTLLQPPVNYINVQHAVQYRQEIGIRLRIKQAFGLTAKGLYINAFARILKGSQSIQLPELPEHWGGEEKFLTRKHDFTSLQSSPRWMDPSVVLHPYFDQQSALLVQIFGMNATYVPNPSTDQRGHVISKNDQELQLEPLLGWTIFSLFDRHCVSSGIHSAPLFQGLPNAEFLQSLSSEPLKDSIQKGLNKKSISLLKSHGSVTVETWDGHYLDDEHYTLPVVNDLLTVDNVKKFLSIQTNKKGKELSVLVLQSLDKKQWKVKRNSPEYQQHERFFEEAMAEKFYDLIEMALLNAGYGPL
ncbi:uncharacterized protein RCH25_043834 [Pelodytes ibericus]